MADLPIFSNGADFNNEKLINLAPGVSGTDGVNLDQLNAAIAGGVNVVGPYDATTNTPDLVTPAPGVVEVGDLYVVSVGGVFFGENLEVGDTLIASANDPTTLGDWIIVQDNLTQITYTRTLFVNQQGSDTLSYNDGKNPDRAFASIPKAIAAATAIVLAPGEFGVIKVTDTGPYPHSSATFGDGVEKIPDGWSLDMPDASLSGFAGGAGNELELGRTCTLKAFILDLDGGFDITMKSGGGNIIKVDSFRSVASGGKIHVTSTAVGHELSLEARNPNINNNAFLFEGGALARMDINIGPIQLSPPSASYDILKVTGGELIGYHADIRRPAGGAGVVTGIRATGAAKVCIYGNNNKADIEYATEDTASMDIFTCMDNGTSDAAGGAINIVSPGSLIFDLAAILVAGNNSSGNNIDMTTTDSITFNAASHYISAADTNVLTIAANKGLLVTAQGTEMSYGANVLDLKNTSTNSFIRLGYTTGSIAINDGTWSGNISIPALTSGRTWTLPDATGTIALTTDIPANDGKVKINGSGGVKPSYAVASGVDQIVDYGVSPLDLSLAPTTEWPQNVSTPTDSDIWDSVNGTLIENTILGQQHFWRVIINYSGKPTGTSSIDSMDIIIRNTLSGFEAVDSYTLPRNQSAESNRQFLISTIADGLSLPAPFGTGQGYELIINSNIAMTVEIESVTRISLHHNTRP